jgi:hypothetical protein
MFQQNRLVEETDSIRGVARGGGDTASIISSSARRSFGGLQLSETVRLRLTAESAARPEEGA